MRRFNSRVFVSSIVWLMKTVDGETSHCNLLPCYVIDQQCPCLVYRRRTSRYHIIDLTITTTSSSGAADQSQLNGCLVTSGHCRPSTADEEWHFPKRPSSTVAVQHRVICMQTWEPHWLLATYVRTSWTEHTHVLPSWSTSHVNTGWSLFEGLAHLTETWTERRL